MIRFFDIFLTLVALILLSPLLIFLSVYTMIDSPGGPFYLQWRIGKNGISFRIWKYRTMYQFSDKQFPITVGNNDSRITRAGRILRKYKLDELPQLLNVLKGEMSLVGPRPELKRYVDLYNHEQRKILHVKPGMSDIASLVFSDENNLLKGVGDPESFYINRIMPLKIRLNKIYTRKYSVGNYFTIIGWSFLQLFRITCSRIRQSESICTELIWRHQNTSLSK